MRRPEADTYTHGHHDSVLRSHRWRTVENSAAYLLPHLAAGVDLLDVGCGPGTITADLAERVASVVGIDPSAPVIDEARAAFPDIDFRVADLFDVEAGVVGGFLGVPFAIVSGGLGCVVGAAAFARLVPSFSRYTRPVPATDVTATVT